jgi:hypothetical protein
VLELELAPSRIHRAWWWSLHALLALAVALLAAPALLKALAFAGLVGHAAARRPRAGPRTIELGPDGCCAVPEWDTGRRGLGPGTLVAPFWVRLDLGPGVRRRYIFLFADQVEAAEWQRVRALLFRLRSG